jgi:hypothetical protein
MEAPQPTVIRQRRIGDHICPGERIVDGDSRVEGNVAFGST